MLEVIQTSDPTRPFGLQRTSSSQIDPRRAVELQRRTAGSRKKSGPSPRARRTHQIDPLRKSQHRTKIMFLCGLAKLRRLST